VFRGSIATLARDGPGSAVYFATYEVVKKALTPASGELSLSAVIIAGGLAGTSMWTLVFPIDTIKSQLQSGDRDVTLAKVLRTTYARGGIKAFFPGLAPALLRSFPANG
jgi:solute carrier family 25 carnitine/acylcarnitine transporter 20/29